VQLLYESNIQLLLRNQNLNISSPHRSGQASVEQGLRQNAPSHGKAFSSAFAGTVATLNTGWHPQFCVRPNDRTKNQSLTGSLFQTRFRFLDGRVSFQCGLQDSLQSHRAGCVCEGNYKDDGEDL
jgi:hypothetical protein